MTPRHFNLSFDMDNIDVLLDAYGIRFDGYDDSLMYRTAVRRMIDMLDRLGIRATFFMVGQCFRNESNVAVLRELAGRGHEIANHSFSHGLNYQLTEEAMLSEIVEADRIIKEKVGVKPVGYRAPGYLVTNKVMRVLEDNGYIYDASVMPTLFFAAMWFALYARTLNPRNRPHLRRFVHLLNHSGPFRVKGSGMMEIPCPHALRVFPYYPTFHFAFPYLEAPIHRWIDKRPFLSFEGHALDFLDVKEDGLPEALARFHPGMALPWRAKVEYYEKILKKLLRTREQVTLESYAANHRDSLPERRLFI